MSLQQLAALVAHPLPNPADEHDRWPVYQRAIDRADAAPLLKAALAAEPDNVLATSVVLHLLERVSNEQHEDWLALLRDRTVASRRSQEIHVLRRAGDLTTAELTAGVPDWSDWSDWLQLRLAPHLTADALAVLAEHGRTKRIRQSAVTLRNR